MAENKKYMIFFSSLTSSVSRRESVKLCNLKENNRGKITESTINNEK